MVGRSGFAAPGEKREGDGRTPTGTFALRRAFGDGPQKTRLDYRVVDAGDVWVDDATSPDYNRWVRRDATSATSFEDLLRRDEVYGRAIVVEYNTDPVQTGAGSAIFLHVWRADGRPTAGCVAIARPEVDRLLAWLEPAAHPVLLLRGKDR
jgi:L,D-peptidoglycan transpeptidase YkuD (ErfK/YbiS/YcfS/YnhG family)